MLRRLSAALAVALVAACGGDGATGPVPASLSLQLAADTVRPGAVLLVDLAGGRTSSDSIPGSIGGTDVTLLRLNDSSLAVLTPQIAPGGYTLTVELPDDTATAAITVLSPLTFVDPQAAISGMLDAQVAAVPLAAPASVSPAQWNAYRAMLDSLVQDAKTQIASLTPEQQLEVARLLASISPQAVATSASLLNWKDPSCRNAMRAVGRTGMVTLYSVGSLVFFLLAPADPITKAVGAVVSAGAVAGTMFSLVDDWDDMAAKCFVQTTVDVSTSAPSLSFSRSSGISAQTSGSQRFFKGRGVTYYPIGNFRPLSRLEAAKDAEVATIASTIDRLRAQYARLVSLLPSSLAGRIMPPPAGLAQNTSGSLTSMLVPPSDVRIEKVTPSSVGLAMSASGTAIVLTPSGTVTQDVPFTYDLVAVSDPAVRRTMQGVLRPLMSATHIIPDPNVVGTRSEVMINNVSYGRLSCSGAWSVRVTGGDKAEWEDFSWVMSGPGSESGSTPIRDGAGNRITFESGDHPFNGGWFWMSSEDGVPQYKPFSVVVTVTYKDLVTGTIKSAVSPTLNCV